MYRLTDFQELDRLERIRMGFSQLHKREKSEEISKAMGFFNRLESLTQQQIASFLPEHKKNFGHVVFKPKDRFEKGWDETYGWMEVAEKQCLYAVCCDAPISFGLKQNNFPVAITSFFPSDNNSILIYQFQGINAYALDDAGNVKTKLVNGERYAHTLANRGLKGLDHKSYFLDIISLLSRDLNYETVGIQSAENNPSTKIDWDGKTRLPYERAIKIYDEFALLNGFEYGSDGNLYKSLE